MVQKIGHTAEQAAIFLSRFRGHAAKQMALVNAAVAANAWAPAVDTSSPGGVMRDRKQKTVRALAHAIKGAASMIGAHRFTAACRALQDASEALGDGRATTDAERDTACACLEVWRSEFAALDEVIMDEMLREDTAEMLTARNFKLRL